MAWYSVKQENTGTTLPCLYLTAKISGDYLPRNRNSNEINLQAFVSEVTCSKLHLQFKKLFERSLFLKLPERMEQSFERI
jgi:hypothetical protein